MNVYLRHVWGIVALCMFTTDHWIGGCVSMAVICVMFWAP